MPTPIIPRPNYAECLPDSFFLSKNTLLKSDFHNAANARFLQKEIAQIGEFELNYDQSDHQTENIICLSCSDDPGFDNSESYLLKITAKKIDIQSSSPQGVFYGIQSLRQLLPKKARKQALPWSIDCLHIQDTPRFAWRGFMLDEARHFQGKKTVLELLDIMALLKMNIFHWHLTEDQGWRIEIKRFPKLTEIGSHRPGTAYSLRDRIFKRDDDIPQNGFYTQAELREIVEYAADRHITIVPEIEMPGHSLAALAAYPEHSCSGGPFSVRRSPGISKDLYCPAKESTIFFLENILEEVLDIFPGEYIHLGGDEAPKTRWENCPDCQTMMSEKGFTKTEQLQTWLMNHFCAWLRERGRKALGWNENLAEGLDQEMIIQYWTGKQDEVVQSARGGRKLILSPYLDYYLDHAYSLTPLTRSYLHEPVFAELAENEEAVLGIETPLWTEYVANKARLDYQVYPRLLAVAESAWTQKENKSLEDFRKRYEYFKSFLEEKNIQYASDKQIETNWLQKLFSFATLITEQNKVSD